MKKDENSEVVTILSDIRDEVRRVSTYASRTSTATNEIRQHVQGIRLGDTGRKATLRKDPLSRAERRQVDIVKSRYAVRRIENPHYSLFSISKAVRKEDLAAGIRGGYKTDLALNSRASTEIKREDAGLLPF